MSKEVSPLSAIRQKINDLDDQLLQLLSDRKQLILDVANIKLHSHLAIRDQTREKELLHRLVEKGRTLGLTGDLIHGVFQPIIADSVLMQQALLQQQFNPQSYNKAKIAFLGAKGSYSHLATHQFASRHFDQVIEYGCHKFEEIFHYVDSGQVDFGLLPLENSSSGSINEVYDLLQATPLSIVAELTIPINHCLLAYGDTEISQIEKVYSHPQPFQQCHHYLVKHPEWIIEYCESTAAAMEHVAALKSNKIAAIGSEAGGKLYQLHVIDDHLANQKHNITRFIVIARKPIDVAPQIAAKTTLIVSTGQQAGALVELLLILRQHNITMTKLESRPMSGNPWEEMFYIDVQANINELAMTKALKELGKMSRSLRILGCYPNETIIPVAES